MESNEDKMKDFFKTEDIAESYDVVVLGAGPAGCTAGMYCSRDDLSTLILEKSYPGGNVAITEHIENYPASESITGSDLATKFFSQAVQFGAIVRYGVVKRVELDEEIKYITLDDDRVIKCKTLIIATGSKPKHLGVPGESKFIGRGVSFCATCDGGFFRGKEVVVVGGGDSALEEGGYLTKFASKVTVIHRRNEFRAAKIVQKRALENKFMHFITDSVVTEVLGDVKIEGVKIKNVKTGAESVLKTDGIFSFIGWHSNSELFVDKVELNKDGFIITDEFMQTNVKGVFAAGDVRQKALMQIITAASDGAIAARRAEKYIVENFNEK